MADKLKDAFLRGRQKIGGAAVSMIVIAFGSTNGTCEEVPPHRREACAAEIEQAMAAADDPAKGRLAYAMAQERRINKPQKRNAAGFPLPDDDEAEATGLGNQRLDTAAIYRKWNNGFRRPSEDDGA